MHRTIRKSKEEQFPSASATDVKQGCGGAELEHEHEHEHEQGLDWRCTIWCGSIGCLVGVCIFLHFSVWWSSLSCCFKKFYSWCCSRPNLPKRFLGLTNLPSHEIGEVKCYFHSLQLLMDYRYRAHERRRIHLTDKPNISLVMQPTIMEHNGRIYSPITWQRWQWGRRRCFLILNRVLPASIIQYKYRLTAIGGVRYWRTSSNMIDSIYDF